MSPDPGAIDDGVARAWIDHLRAGGTATWHDWCAAPRTAGSWSGPVPGAAQLELVRRLAMRRERRGTVVAGPAFTDLADRALRRSGPGRGQPDRPLPLPPPSAPRPRLEAAPGQPVGPAPLDPSEVSRSTLVRLGIGLLADLVLDAGPLPEAPVRRHRPWPRPRLQLVGAPVSVDAVRASLAAAGHREGGRAPEVLLLAQPLDEHLAQVWSTRVQHGAPVRWDTFAGRWARRDALPPSADLPRLAGFWAEQVGASRVHVLVEPAIHDVASVLGLRRVPSAAAARDVHDLSAEALDVLRRLNRVLNVRAVADEREGLLRRARTLLPSRTPRPIALPESGREWAERRARRVQEQIRTGGYAVHGDLAALAPRHRGAVAPRRPEVLTLVLEACLRTASAGDRGVGG